MELPIRSTLVSVGRYAMQQPTTIVDCARHVLSSTVPVPLDALRWLASRVPSTGKEPMGLQIESRPPGLHVGATLGVMGATIRAGITITIRALEISVERIRITVGLSDLSLESVGDATSPLAGLIKSGALDLTKPGNLANIMPKRPEAIVDVGDDYLVLDLFRVESLARNPTINKVIRTVTPVANINSISTQRDLLLISLRITLGGIPAAVAALRT